MINLELQTNYISSFRVIILRLFYTSVFPFVLSILMVLNCYCGLAQTQFQRTIKYSTAASQILDIAETFDDSLIMSGRLQFSNEEALLIKADKNGTPVWTKYYGFATGEYGFKIKSSVNGDHICPKRLN
jgi:hypothetical protein